MNLLRAIFSEPPGLIEKLAALKPPENKQQLEEAFKDYQDPAWIMIEESSWKGIWRLHLFGLWRLQRLDDPDSNVVAQAQRCFQLYQQSFERLASRHQEMKKPLNAGKDLSRNQSLEVIQYLFLAGMPWHLSQLWSLPSNRMVQEFLLENDKENGEWPELLFKLFGPDSANTKLTPEQWAKLERFLWTSVVLIYKSEGDRHYLTWMDLLEEWAHGHPGRTTLLNNLKLQMKLARCGRLFSDCLPKEASVPPPTTAAPSPARPAAVSRHGRGSRIASPQPGRARAASSNADSGSHALSAAQLIEAGWFINSDAQTGDKIEIHQQSSLKLFLVQKLLSQLADIPGLSLDKLRKILSFPRILSRTL